MAQLKDDCFTGDGALTPLDAVLAMLAERLEPVSAVETVPLADALGRVLAEDVVASRDVPPHDNAAVDGYAVFFDDLAAGAETRLPVTGRIAAGHPLGRPAVRGEAVQVFTGAVMPEGPDTIFMIEDCQVDGDHVRLPAGLKRGANRRARGEDVSAGAMLMRAGRRMRPQEVGLAASVGLTALRCRARLRVAVFSTGDEIRDPADTAPDGCVFDSNRTTVMGLLGELGCRVTDLGILPDDESVIREALAAAARDHDLLMTTGGVSMGEEDHVRAAVEALGSLYFWRVAIKPGRPIALGQVGAAAFAGLPGNPVAAMVTFMLIVRPLIFGLMGRTDGAPTLYRVRAGFSHSKKKGRGEWLRARLEVAPDGVPVAIRHPRGGAGILTSMVESDGLVGLPEDTERIEEGDMVNFLPFSEVST